MYPRSVLNKNKKNITNFHLKITIFLAVKNHSILHRQDIVMRLKSSHDHLQTDTINQKPDSITLEVSIAQLQYESITCE